MPISKHAYIRKLHTKLGDNEKCASYGLHSQCGILCIDAEMRVINMDAVAYIYFSQCTIKHKYFTNTAKKYYENNNIFIIFFNGSKEYQKILFPSPNFFW